MKRLLSIALLVALACVCARGADYATVVFNLNDFAVGGSLSNRLMRVQPVDVPAGVGAIIITRDRRHYTADANGTITITNMVGPLTYRCEVERISTVPWSTNTVFQITVPNTNGTLNANALMTSATAVNAAVTQSAGDLRYVLKSNGTALAVTLVSGTNIFHTTNGTAGQFLTVGPNGNVYPSTVAPGGGSGEVTYANLVSSNYFSPSISGQIVALTDKASPVAADRLLIEDSAASNAKRDITIASLETALEGMLALQDLLGAVTDAQIPAAITRDAEWNTIGEIETATGVNILVSTEVDTEAELEALIGGLNVIFRTEIDSIAELETLTGLNIITSTELFPFISSSNFVSTSISDQYDAVLEKATPIGTDRLLIEDAAAGNAKKYITIESQETALEGVLDLQQLQGSLATAQIDNDAVTYAKLQNSSDTQRVLGRNTSGSGNFEEVTLTQLLDWIGSASHGDILYRGASGWARLPAGTSGQVLQSQGSGANPIWATGGGGGGSQTPLGQNVDADGFGFDELGYLIRTTTNLSGTLPDAVIQGPQVMRYFPTNTWMINIVKPSAANKGASFTIHITNTNDPPYSGIVSNSWAAAGNELVIVGATNSIIKGEWDGTNVTIASWHARNVVSNMTVDTPWNGATTYAASMDVLHDYFALSDADFDGQPSNVEDNAVATADLQDDAVTVAKFQNLATDRLLGRDTAGTGDAEQLTVGGGLEFSGSGSIQRAAITGVVTATAGGNPTFMATDAVQTTNIASGVVSNAKLANMVSGTIKARATGSTGAPEDATLSPGIGFSSGALVITNVYEFCLSDETTALTTGANKVIWRAPHAMTLVGLRASLSTASSSGVVTVDINKSGSTILSTKLTIDASEKTSLTAATPHVFSSTTLADDEEVTFDQDAAGTTAAGMKVKLYYIR